MLGFTDDGRNEAGTLGFGGERVESGGARDDFGVALLRHFPRVHFGPSRRESSLNSYRRIESLPHFLELGLGTGSGFPKRRKGGGKTLVGVVCVVGGAWEKRNGLEH